MTSAQATAFYEQIATMARGGLSLRQSLQVLGARRPTAEVRALEKAFNQGLTMAEAFAEAGFDPLEVRLIEAGEQSGRVGDVYQQLAVYHRGMKTARARIWGQLLYPLFVLHLAAVLGPVRLIVENPVSYGWAVAGNLVQLYLLAFGLRIVWSVTWPSALGQGMWLRLPLVGRAARATACFRWINAVYLQFASGLPLPEAVARAWGATFFAAREERAMEAETRLRAGDELSEVMLATPEFPVEWTDYLRAGEVSGRTKKKSLRQLTAVAEIEWQQALDNLARWLPKLVYGVIVLSVAWQLIGGAVQTFQTLNQTLESAGY